MSGPNFVTTNANAGDVDSVAKEARKKKIKELEASLFGSENNADLLWNPRYVIFSDYLFQYQVVFNSIFILLA